MQHERLAHEGLGCVVDLSDGARLAIEHAVEHAGEREQVVALVLERDAHGADALLVPVLVPVLARLQFGDDEVEHLLPRGESRRRPAPARRGPTRG